MAASADLLPTRLRRQLARAFAWTRKTELRISALQSRAGSLNSFASIGLAPGHEYWHAHALESGLDGHSLASLCQRSTTDETFVLFYNPCSGPARGSVNAYPILSLSL